MTNHEAGAVDRPVPSRVSKPLNNSSTSNVAKGNLNVAAAKRKTEDENGLDVEENGVRLKVNKHM